MLRGWQAHLQKLSESLHVEASTTTSAAREREIFYEIDAAQSREPARCW